MCVPFDFIMRRKYFAGKCIYILSLTMNIFEKVKKHSFQALKVVDKPSHVID